MIRYLAAVLLALAAAGCSPSAEIAYRANEIAARSREDLSAWDRVEQAHPDMKREAKYGRARAEATIADTAGVHEALTGVEDQHPVLNIMGWIAGAVIAVAVAVILWQTGLGTMIRVAIGWLPKPKVQEADLAVAMLDESKPERARELVAMKRGQDPLFDAAFRKAKAGEQKGEA